MEKDRGPRWKVVESFTYEVGHLGSGEKITVPKNFLSDLASVPRYLWVFVPPDGNYTQAAVLHDWLCENRGRVERFYNNKEVSRIFLESMGVLKVGYLTRHAIYWAVLWFGPKF